MTGALDVNRDKILGLVITLTLAFLCAAVDGSVALAPRLGDGPGPRRSSSRGPGG